jgi:hypothetical protein
MEQLCNCDMVVSLACEENKEDVLNSFSGQYTEAYFMPCQMDPGNVWNTLKLVYDAFDEIRFHERNMDKELFQQFLVEGGGALW